MRAAARVAIVAAVVALAPHVGGAAVFEVAIQDGPDEGLNDTTPRAPVGGNTGTTLGAQRLNALRAAATLWGAFLESDVPIVIAAQFDPLLCEPMRATLGMAGPRNFFRDFAGAPVTGTWFPVALANSIAGLDLNPSAGDITAQFSSSIDSGCFLGAPQGWYYGLDFNPPETQADFFDTILHELAHGLGFSSAVNLATGEKLGGFDDAFTRHLEDHRTGQRYPQMNDAARVIASTGGDNLHWLGENVRLASGFLTAGRSGDHVQMYAPQIQEPGSSVVHFDTSLEPHELMEPFYEPGSARVLAQALLRDIGWATTALVGDPGDGNCDGRRGAADVVAVVDAVGQGGDCPGLNADEAGGIDAADVAATVTRLFML